MSKICQQKISEMNKQRGSKENAENQLKDRIERFSENAKGLWSRCVRVWQQCFKNIEVMEGKWEEWDIIFRDLDVTVNINISEHKDYYQIL